MHSIFTTPSSGRKWPALLGHTFHGHAQKVLLAAALGLSEVRSRLLPPPLRGACRTAGHRPSTVSPCTVHFQFIKTAHPSSVSLSLLSYHCSSLLPAVVVGHQSQTKDASLCPAAPSQKGETVPDSHLSRKTNRKKKCPQIHNRRSTYVK